MVATPENAQQPAVCNFFAAAQDEDKGEQAFKSFACPLTAWTRFAWIAPLSGVGKTRRAFFDIGADRLGLIGTAQQLLLLDGFGEQRRTGIDG
jgi:hypothetical protein